MEVEQCHERFLSADEYIKFRMLKYISYWKNPGQNEFTPNLCGLGQLVTSAAKAYDIRFENHLK